MDAKPNVVLNDALEAGKQDILNAGARISTMLAEQLADDPHYAVIEITFKARITHPETGVVVEGERKENYYVHGDRMSAMF